MGEEKEKVRTLVTKINSACTEISKCTEKTVVFLNSLKTTLDGKLGEVEAVSQEGGTDACRKEYLDGINTLKEHVDKLIGELGDDSKVSLVEKMVQPTFSTNLIKNLAEYHESVKKIINKCGNKLDHCTLHEIRMFGEIISCDEIFRNLYHKILVPVATLYDMNEWKNNNEATNGISAEYIKKLTQDDVLAVNEAVVNYITRMRGVLDCSCENPVMYCAECCSSSSTPK